MYSVSPVKGASVCELNGHQLTRLCGKRKILGVFTSRVSMHVCFTFFTFFSQTHTAFPHHAHSQYTEIPYLALDMRHIHVSDNSV